MLRALATVLLCAAASCRADFATQVCSTAAEPAVSVRLTDAATGAPISGATVFIIELDAVEVGHESSPGQYDGAFERAGTFRVEIEAPGYEAHQVDDVTAPAQRCGPETQILQIQLRRISESLPVVIIVADEEGGATWHQGRLTPAGDAEPSSTK